MKMHIFTLDNDKQEQVVINPERVDLVAKDETGESTIIYVNGTTVRVKESIREVHERLTAGG